jgi:hypothetical protein
MVASRRNAEDRQIDKADRKRGRRDGPSRAEMKHCFKLKRNRALIVFL